MPSNYAQFEVKIKNRTTNIDSMVASQTVKVFNVAGNVALADKVSDASGIVAGGTLAVAVGTLIRFSFWRADGECGKAEQTTT